MKANIWIPNDPEGNISKLLSLIGQPARVQILFVLAAQEACVCHLEAALEMRQASISQHLMALRKGGIVAAKREGRNMFYSLAHPQVLEFLVQAARFTGSDLESLHSLGLRPVNECPCLQCNPDLDPDLTCKNFRRSKPTYPF